MKKILSICAIVCVLVAALSISVYALTPNGDGVYEIASAQDLLDFRALNASGSKAILVDDIDMSGKEWTPFGDISISIDGQGHTISNLTYTATGAGNRGLIVNTLQHNGGVYSIENLKLANCSLTVNEANGGTNVGLVAGYTDRTAVLNVTTDNCTLTVTHTGDSEVGVGALVGRADWAYNGYKNETIPVTGTVNDTCTINVSSEIAKSTFVAGIVGSHNGSTLVISNTVSNAAINTTIADKADYQPAAFVYQLWAAAIIENSTTNSNLPLTNTIGNLKEIVSVGTAEELNAVVERMNSGKIGYADITLTADIDYTDKTWTPIAVSDYKGVLDGANHTISNIHLVYNEVTSGYYGILVNHLSNGPSGTVQNLTLKNCSITVNTPEGGSTGEINLGGVAGRYNRGHVDNVHLENVDVALNGAIGTNQNAFVGGILGMAWWNGPQSSIGIFNCSLDDQSSVIANVTSGTPNAAGILGYYQDGNLKIDGCTNYATVKSSHLAGGILGYATPSATCVISNTKNYGTVESGNIAGSIIGTCNGDNVPAIDNCVAGGFVIGTNTGSYACWSEPAVTNSKDVAIINPLTAGGEDNLQGYYQTAAGADEGKLNIRVLFLAKEDYILAVDTLNIKVTFTKADATVKEYNGALGNVVYRQIKADGDTFTAPEDIIIFGNLFTGVPTADVDGFTITVTDGTGATVYTGAASLKATPAN